VVLLLAIAAGAQQPVPPLPVRTPAQSSTSATGQFIIHGTDLATRGAFCLLCDDVAAALGRLLRDDARYSLPVVIVLKSPPDAALTGPAVTWNISQLAHGGFHLQINAALRAEFRGDDFAREVVRLLLAERILRSHKELKTTRQNVLPNWVLTGVTQALEFRGRSRPSVLFAAVFRNGQIYSVDKVLSADPAQLDAPARGIYETSACALVLALLDQPDGPLRFAKFLDALARNDKSDRDLLRQLFPTLGASKNSLEKWWSLQMATLATPSPLESLGIDETESRLRDALTLVLEPLPEKEKKKKTAAAAPVKKAETQDKPEPEEDKKEEKPKSRFRLPFFGGKKVLYAPASDSDTDGAGSATKKKAPEKSAASEGKSGPEKAAAQGTSEKPKTPAKEPAKKTDAASPESKDEATEPGKRSRLNPLNWFRRKEKPDSEESKEETSKEPASKEETAAKKTASPATKKARESAAPPPRQDPPAPGREPDQPKGQTLPLDEFVAVWKRDDRDKIFQRSLNQLNALKLQAHPLYRPLIGEYAAAVRLLISGKQKGVTEKLAALREQHARILEQARAVESHLDWYEASQTRSYSGAFDDYLKLGDKLDNEIRTRHDALSKYLDTLEKEYQ